MFKTILENNMQLINISPLLLWNHVQYDFCLYQSWWRNLSCKPWIVDSDLFNVKQVTFHISLCLWLCWPANWGKQRRASATAALPKKKMSSGFNLKGTHLMYEAKLFSRKLKWNFGLKCSGESLECERISWSYLSCQCISKLIMREGKQLFNYILLL